MSEAQDMSEYLGVFLDEATEQLALLEANILELEHTAPTPDMMQVLFRAAHTVKGSSRAMGFMTIGNLTHEMENLLDALRKNEISLSPEIIDALLRCSDTLGGLIESVRASGSDQGADGAALDTLIRHLESLRPGSTPVSSPAVLVVPSGSSQFSLTERQQTLVAQSREAGTSVFQVSVTLSSDCMMKSIRVFMTFGALEPLGQILAANPAQEALEEEQFDCRFDLLVATSENAEMVESALSKLSEVEHYAVAPYVPSAATGGTPSLDRAQQAAPLPGEESHPIPLLSEGGARRSPDSASAPVHPIPQNQAAGADAPKSAAPAQQTAQTVRVDVSRLDNLLNLVGEMVIERTQLAVTAKALHEKHPQDEHAAALPDFINRLERVTGELQDQIMKARMLPVDGVFQRFPRMVRDLAQKVGKEIDFQITGGETELDRTVLECIGDPIIHLLRNSLDHGIETPVERLAAGKSAKGAVTLSARHIESSIVIEVTDDGKGIDPVKIRAASVRKGNITQAQSDQMTDKDALMLIFASGLSTASTVSDISGRGVGMDIVKSNIERLGGQILIESVVGVGSKFTIRLPLTLAIMRTLLVRAGAATYVLPLSSVVEMVRVGDAQGQARKRSVQGQGTIVLRGRTVPLASLAMLLAGDPNAVASESVPDGSYLVVVGFGDRQVGLAVDALIGQQETVIKSLGVFLGDIPGISGATILGNGNVALIVDAPRAVDLARALLPDRVAAGV